MALVSNSLDLPEPDPEARAHSGRVAGRIDALIQEKGKITFAEFMEIALYTPDLGYYTGPGEIFGDAGDFITAPELSELFGRCVAHQAQQVLQGLGGGDILEFGAGSGKLAVDMLTELEKQQCLPNQYLIVDISPGLRSRQKKHLEEKLPHLVDRIMWLDEVPENFRGIIVGNEVLDAMPVHRVRFHQNGEHKELYVIEENGSFSWQEGEPGSELLQNEIATIFDLQGRFMADGYESEINLFMRPWIKALHDNMEAGAVILIDYGYPRHEFYHPERYEGTLMCHYQHRAHGFPLMLPGLQDLTAHVDFTAVAECGLEAGFHVSGFTNQVSFLSACGLERMLQEVDPADIHNFLAFIQPVKRLILPTEMGELFKVIGLTKNFDQPLLGFTLVDQRSRL